MTTARRRLAALFILLFTATFYLLPFLDRGWIPSDEGLLAHSAERVLQGELPHRDFGDMYTGGLAFLHAAAFAVWGVELSSLRLLLYLSALLAIPLLFHLASRHGPPWLAAVVAMVCIVWTVPNYFASMPSWYNLFLTLAALAALRAHIDHGNRLWLVLAGVLTGASFLIKSSALLLLAAVFLFLVHREAELDDAPEDARSPAWNAFVAGGVLLFLAVLARFISKLPAPAEFLVFFAPPAFLGVALILDALRRPSSAFAIRLRRLLGLALPYLAGVLTPIALFVALYAARGGVDALLSGAYLFVEKRLQFTIYALPRAETAIFALPLLALLLLPLKRPLSDVAEKRLLAPLALLLVAALAYAPQRLVYQSIWFSFRPLPTAIALVGALWWFRRRREMSSVQRQSLFLTLVIMALVNVTQFPFARGVYFCYVAPLVVLAAYELIRLQIGAPRRLHAAFLAFYALFGAFWLNLGWVEAHGMMFYSKDLGSRLQTERGELWVSAEEKQSYERVVELVREHSDPGDYIYAAPDCPEVYFLADRRNPTRSFYDYFEEDFGEPQRIERILTLLEEVNVDVVVLHRIPNFSGRPVPALEAELRRRYPRRFEIEPRFTVLAR